MDHAQGSQCYHRVDLETAAALGCTKCIAEYETGEKTRQTHDDNCPRKRPFHDPSTKNTASGGGGGGDVASSSSSSGSKRKRIAQDDSTTKGGGGENYINNNNNNNAKNGNTKGDDDGGNGNDTTSSSSSLRTTRVGNNVDFPVSNLHSHLTCSLCKGYFRDPHTVAECLHTFCRSCLILYFRQGMRCCPTCNIRLGPDPFHTSISIQSREVIPDRTLAEVVNKIFPWMKAQEEEDERNFYAQRGIELKPEYVQQEGTTTKGHGGSGSHHNHGGSRSSRGSSGGGRANVSTGMVADDLLDLSLEPDGQPPNIHQRLPSLRNSLLRTSGRLKIVSVKKYLAQRLGMKESNNLIELLCNGDPMGDELSLTFILRTRWFSDNKVLTLKYRLEEEDSK